ncbi:alkylmercury lyase [Nocardia asteroides NBRC 15531]|uniref:Alkylmercury lyase family protein n=1 Tax=Nocardia asteroides NBRC 15531 TaxID=1110697 RepID=U5EA85_NOCAS|nr:organomercurial lyase [Nocardia asteroides]TLF64196.1 alkylmercury lyase [Nocardia asteroides NBRC 15531]UGT50702.1 alkylmercury lyase [Nocardia asteroides]SFN30409.1 Alkylmercury lyase [Nocardia asteroides]VEG36468.1 Alkylmercury lyase [Nocardia asteroides]GAD83341.1 alkylmercury lyase family protein [Nocardia asteroides NBRC 15531]
MRLEILQVADCPNVPVLEERIRRAVADRPVDVEIVHRVIDNAEQAASAGMTGSPTLLVDGRDPFAVDGSVTSVSCRLYPSANGLDGAPSVSALRTALGLDEAEGVSDGDEITACCPSESGAASALDELSSQRDDARPANPVERAVHHAILRGFAERGRPPTAMEISEVVAGQYVSIASVLRRLHETDVIRLNGDGEIASAYPFSGTPTPHRVQIIDGPIVYAMCAVDALGLAAMLDTDVEVSSADPVTHAPITVVIHSQHLTADPATAVVFVGGQANQETTADACCNYLNFFTDRPAAEAWAADHPEVSGLVLDLPQAHDLGNQIFANMLHGVS